MKEETEEYYPKWLFEAIVDEHLPWEKAKDYSYEEFSEKYTLNRLESGYRPTVVKFNEINVLSSNYVPSGGSPTLNDRLI